MSAYTEKALKLLDDAEGRIASHKGIVGLDGFVDQIIRVVDKRQKDGTATYVAQISQWASRIQAASGKSTKFDLSVQQVKLGGNGPIMANALASFGLPLTCIGNMGYPSLHSVFEPMKSVCEVISVAEPSYTDALEFDDGKIMLSRQEASAEITWERLNQVIGKENLFQLLNEATFIALDSWTAIPHMSDIWRKLQKEICPRLSVDINQGRRKLFFDLGDPEFRLEEDIYEAMEFIGKFQKWFDVTLGLNQKEAEEIGGVLKLSVKGDGRDFIHKSAEAIRMKLQIDGVVVHAVAFAASASKDSSALLDGPYVEKPLISTGAGDHFNAGYSLGVVLGGDLEQCLQLGVATSGFYVRTAQSPSLKNLREFLQKLA